MDDESRRAVIRRFVNSVNTAERAPLDALYHDNPVIAWPQSGELIHGKRNIRELRLAYGTPPKVTLRRIVGSGDSWATEMVSDYDRDRFYVPVLHEYRGDRVPRATSYHAAPFEAPSWRAQWVERA